MQQADAFAVVGDRELDLLGAAGRDRHPLADHVDLVGDQAGDARVGALLYELDLLRIIEEVLRDQMGEVDVHADELAALVLEVPGRVGRARADDEMSTIENLMQLALRGVDQLGLGLRGKQQRGCGSGNSTHGGTGSHQRATADPTALEIFLAHAYPLLL